MDDRLQKRKFCAPIFFVLAVIGAGCGASNGDARTGPVLAATPVTEEVPAGPERAVVVQFVLTNNGSDVLKIDRVETSCSCTVAKLATAELLPGERTVLQVKALRPLIGFQATSATVYSNSSDAPLSLTVKCWASDSRPRWTHVTPSQVSLSNLDGGHESSEIEILTVEVNNARLIPGTVECDIPFVAVVPTHSDVTTTFSPNFSSRKYSFLAALADGHPFGRFSGNVTIQLDKAQCGNRLSEITIPVEVITTPPVYADPPGLFASIADGAELAHWPVNLRKRSPNFDDDAISAEVDAHWLAVQPGRAEPSDGNGLLKSGSPWGNMIVRMTAVPRANPAKANVTIKMRDARLPDIIVPVTVTSVPPGVHGTNIE